MFSGGRLVDVLSADVLPMFCRRTSCRCLFALTAGPRAVGDPRCVGTLPLSDATSVCARRPAWVPGTRKGIGRFRGTPKGGAAAPVRRSTVPPESCSSCGCGCCGSENRRIKPVPCLILRDPNQFATRGNNFHSTKALFRGFSVPSSVCFRSAAEARRMSILIVIVMWMSKTIHGALYRLERTRVGVAIKPCGISVF